jgi:hypothetical protein
MKKTVKPRKTPQQARSRQTREDILEATAHLLNRKPFDEVSTNHIAKKTGISIGTLYMRNSSGESSKVHHAAVRKKALSSTISWKRL